MLSAMLQMNEYDDDDHHPINHDDPPAPVTLKVHSHRARLHPSKHVNGRRRARCESAFIVIYSNSRQIASVEQII